MRYVLQALEHAAEHDQHDSVVNIISSFGKLRNAESSAHLHRISRISRLIADELGYDGEFCDMLYMGATMYDIGKIDVPDVVLAKTNALNEEEQEVMKSHTNIGHEILRESHTAALQMGADIAYSHHEYFNGKGYPRGLIGDAIPIAGRIVAVADEVDRLLAADSHRQKEAFDLMQKESGRHFDPACVRAVLDRRDEILEIENKFPNQAAARSA